MSSKKNSWYPQEYTEIFDARVKDIIRDKKLGISSIGVLTAIRCFVGHQERFESDKTGTFSIKNLAKDCGITVNFLLKTCQKLDEIGLISFEICQEMIEICVNSTVTLKSNKNDSNAIRQARHREKLKRIGHDKKLSRSNASNAIVTPPDIEKEREKEKTTRESNASNASEINIEEVSSSPLELISLSESKEEVLVPVIKSELELMLESHPRFISLSEELKQVTKESIFQYCAEKHADKSDIDHRNIIKSSMDARPWDVNRYVAKKENNAPKAVKFDLNALQARISSMAEKDKDQYGQVIPKLVQEYPLVDQVKLAKESHASFIARGPAFDGLAKAEKLRIEELERRIAAGEK